MHALPEVNYTQQEIEKKSSILKAKMVYDLITRDCLHLLQGGELKVLLFIADRTYGWGKGAEVIPTRHFYNGIQSKSTGEWIIRPLGMSRRQVIRVLNKLNEMKLIRVNERYLTRLLVDNLNSEHIHKALNCDTHVTLMPKTVTPMSHHKRINNKRVNTYGESVREKDLNKNKMNEGTRKKLIALSTEAGKKSISTRESKKTKVWQKQLTATALKLTWEDASREGGFDPKLPNMVSCKILQKMSKKHGAGEFREVLEFTLENWTRLCDVQFGWMTQTPPPEEPCSRFFASRYTEFRDCYRRKDRTERFIGMNARDRHYHTLVERGVSEDMAKEEADAKYGKPTPLSKKDKKPKSKKIKKGKKSKASRKKDRLLRRVDDLYKKVDESHEDTDDFGDFE